ncbi:MAG: hypothetical protein KDA66_03065 [Planctomycetaceae bacterium]|nr:hypothetical protein [Planctomycetaceae bacterium]
MPVYSTERLEVSAEAENGVGTQEMAVKFGCSESWVRRVKQEYREEGTTGPAQTRQRTPKWDAERENIEQDIASAQDRPDVQEQRAQRQVRQQGLDPHRLVLLDETWVKTNMTRPRCRSLCGTRVSGKVLHGHRKTTTSRAGLRITVMVAPLVVDGALDGDSFVAYGRTQPPLF